MLLFFSSMEEDPDLSRFDKRGNSMYGHALRVRRSGLNSFSHALRVRRGGNSYGHALRIRAAPFGHALRIKKGNLFSKNHALRIRRGSPFSHALRIKKSQNSRFPRGSTFSHALRVRRFDPALVNFLPIPASMDNYYDDYLMDDESDEFSPMMGKRSFSHVLRV